MKYTTRYSFVSVLCICCALLCIAAITRTDDCDKAYANAQKAMQWGLQNLKSKKQRMENRLIAEDKLLATVKVEKEINGVRITASGFEGSTEVTITAYRTFESLVKEGIIDKNYLPPREEE